MNKKGFIILAVSSIIVNYIVAVMDAYIRKDLLDGEAGLPFRFESSNLFSSQTNYVFLLLDVVFWFIVLCCGWFLVKRLFGHTV